MAKDKFNCDKEAIKLKREQEKLERAERIKKIQEKEAQRQEELKRQQEERNNQLKRQKEEAEKRRAEQAEKRRLEQEKNELERKTREEAFKAAVANNFENQEQQIRDADGNRWIKCEFCGKIDMEKEFSSYGGIGKVNLGICYDCLKNNPAVYEKNEQQMKVVRKTYNPNICPDCGGQLKEKNGRFGAFMGCTNYPRCRYTRKISSKKY